MTLSASSALPATSKNPPEMATKPDEAVPRSNVKEMSVDELRKGIAELRKRTKEQADQIRGLKESLAKNKEKLEALDIFDQKHETYAMYKSRVISETGKKDFMAMVDDATSKMK